MEDVGEDGLEGCEVVFGWDSGWHGEWLADSFDRGVVEDGL